MLDPITQKKIDQLETYWVNMGKLLSELKSNQPKQNARVRKLSEEQLTEVLTQRQNKINS